MQRLLILALCALAVTAAIAGAAFAFGTPQKPPSPAAQPAPSPSPPGGGAAPDASGMPMAGAVIEDAEIPEPDPASPFTFQIPGCRCHSDDPAVVAEHAEYRVNQCSGCHSGR